MRRTIHKYSLHAREPGLQTIIASQYARVLHVGTQSEDPFALSIWLDTPDEGRREPRTFQFFVTGGYPPSNATYISTHIFDGGSFVLHLYEVSA